MVMTEVPFQARFQIGHVFKFLDWGCACLFRKTGENSNRLAHACGNDLQVESSGASQADFYQGEADLTVDYDQFVADAGGRRPTAERICQVMATVIAVAVGATWLWLMLTDHRVEDGPSDTSGRLTRFSRESKTGNEAI